MANLRRYFFVFSILLALVSLVIIFQESSSAWKPYQLAYQAFLAQSARTPAEQAIAGKFVVGVRQDWLPPLNRADRCRSCHIGVDDPKAPAIPPIAAHPDLDQHPPRQFGCTICHGGEGYATRLPDAHQKIVPVRALEGSCAKCHQYGDLVAEAPTAGAGNKLIARYSCNGCHQFSDRGPKADSGPDLSGIGAKVSARWLAKWLLQPRDYLVQARMPDFLLTDPEILALTDFLVGKDATFRPNAAFFSDSAKGEEMLARLDDDGLDELVDQGKIIFGRLRCLTCHKLHGKGGDLAPELNRIALKSNRQWLGGWLQEPPRYDPQTIMPTFTLTRAERLAVVEYLWWESEVGDEGEVAELQGAQAKDGGAGPEKLEGRKLFVEKGCYNCHGLPGLEVKNDFAPSLADFGDKKISKIDFRKSGIPHTAQDYVAAKLQAPRLFGDNLKMPLFKLAPAEVGQIATVILGQSSKIPDALKRKNPAESLPLPLGEVGRLFAGYKCFSCHRIGANGGSLAPDLTMEGSKVKKEWLIAYLQKPSAIRPFLVERMPRFNMSPAEAELLADYIGMVLRSAKIDGTTPVMGEDPGAGRQLYFDKYQCQNCHTIGKEGGYFGPVLEAVGARLQPQWLWLRLENAHGLEPDSREPVLAISQPDRGLLLAFLQSLVGEKE